MYNKEKEPEPEFAVEEEKPKIPLFSDEVFKDDLELTEEDLDKLPV